MKICVFGASSADIDDSYIAAGEELGGLIAGGGHTLVFGAGADGMMGAAARGAKKAGGGIVGVVPGFFDVDGIIFDGCTELLRPDTMRERKRIMEDMADAFIVTAGGIGTFEEFFEILTLRQLGRHTKPIVVLNTNGYYDSMDDMLEKAVTAGFMTAACKRLYKRVEKCADAIDYIENYVPEEYNILDVRKIRLEK